MQSFNTQSRTHRFAMLAEHPPATSIQAGTPNLIKNLCGHPSHPFCGMVATDHVGPDPVKGPWDTLPTLTLFRPKALLPGRGIGLGLLDNAAFRLQKKRVLRFFEEYDVKKQFIIIANNARFTCFAASIPSNLPRIVYVIDDCVNDSHIYRVSKRKAKAAFSKLIRESDQVFAISPVYARDLEKEYGRPCHFLPIPITHHILENARLQPDVEPGLRLKENGAPIVLHHCGQIHHLYADALQQLLDHFKQLAQHHKQHITLEFYGRLDADIIRSSLAFDVAAQDPADYFQVKLCSSVPQATLLERQRQSDFLLLANSFMPHYEPQIRCSLSSKVVEYLLSGTPIMVYGPSYSGLVTHLRDHKAAHIVSTADPEAVRRQLAEIVFNSKGNGADVAAAARRLALEYHSGDYFFRQVTGDYS